MTALSVSNKRGSSSFIKIINGQKLASFMSFVQYYFICRPCDSFCGEDAGIEPRTFPSFALTVGRSGALLDDWLVGCG
jgi:hypothetical protein